MLSPGGKSSTVLTLSASVKGFFSDFLRCKFRCLRLAKEQSEVRTMPPAARSSRTFFCSSSTIALPPMGESLVEVYRRHILQ
jgi:hypothetical protein